MEAVGGGAGVWLGGTDWKKEGDWSGMMGPPRVTHNGQRDMERWVPHKTV